MPKSCFVIQGFGKKQDYEQGKLFDLDASYELIKESIKHAGLECYRADELRSNQLIDAVMYDQLLNADLVVADISTLNFNAAYELGVRHALRPYSTLIIGEKGLNFPFDINHIYVHTYQHLGEDIGRREAQRFQKELTELAKKAIASTNNDSPVYTFLNQLPEKGYLDLAKAATTPNDLEQQNTSLRELKEAAKKAMAEGEFLKAEKLWEKARQIAKKDDFIVQQLALATYKSKHPDTYQALQNASKILKYLKPRDSFDTETLGLWASVHKRLFEINSKKEDLEEALFALERGFFIKQDYYNGINLAFMLDVKASHSSHGLKNDLHAVARYVRRKVFNICTERMESEEVGKDEEYWILATLYEVQVGLKDHKSAKLWKDKASKAASEPWMIDSTQEQIAKLKKLLD